jgi:hypothetical protein
MIKMHFKFEKGKKRSLIEKALKIAGSERKLSKRSGIPKSSIHHLKF